MINYTPSALDSNETLLQALHRVEKYLKDNPIYKVYAVDANYSADIQQYDLADVIASESNLAEGDVVFFKNNVYAYVSSVGSEVFSVSNASSFKGERGEQGLQGEPGQAGADGKTALECSYIYEVAGFDPSVQITITISGGYFNRRPAQAEKCTFIVRDTTNKITYIITGNIQSTSGTEMNWSASVLTIHAAKISGEKGANGLNGTNGKIALVYDKSISFTYGGGSSQLINVSLSFADFNRIPELNEDFIAILQDGTIQYIAQCEVQSMTAGDVVSQIVASYISKITGENGTNGTDGSDGLSTLMYKSIDEEITDPVLNSIITVDRNKFTRTPEQYENYVFYWYNTVTGHTFLINGQIMTVGVPNCTVILSVIVDITPPLTADSVDSGAATSGQVLTADGSGGANWETPAGGGALNKYYFSTDNYTSANIARIGHILNNGIFVSAKVSIGREIPLSFNTVTQLSSTLFLTGVALASDNLSCIASVIFNTALETAQYRFMSIESNGTITLNTLTGLQGLPITLEYLAESEITA